MKFVASISGSCASARARLCTAFVLATVCASSLVAETVYITSRPQPSGSGANPDGTYAEIGYTAGDTSAKSTAPGVPPRSGSRYFSSGFTNAGPVVQLSPTLTGEVYQVYHTFSSLAGNVSSDVILQATAVSGCSLSFSNNLNQFQTQYGQPAPQSWILLGFLTNITWPATPVLDFAWQSGTVDAGLQKRLVIDCFKFEYFRPCLLVPVPTVIGPLGTNRPIVVVNGITNLATKVAVHQDSGGGMIKIGETNVTSPGATVYVRVSGLVKGAQVSATQTVGGQESCIQPTGPIVGGGPNPRVRVALSVREAPNATGPVGADGSAYTTNNARIHFIGASTVMNGQGPGDGKVVQPRDYYPTEMTQLDISGGNLPGNVSIRESPTLPSAGLTTIKSHPGGGYNIDSFFDVVTEMSLDYGTTWSPATNGPARMTLTSPTPPNYFVTNNLPPLDGRYVSIEEWHGLYANGIIISNVIHRSFTASFPPPPVGASQVHTFGSTADMEVSTDGGQTFTPYSAPGTVTVAITNPLPGWQTVTLQRGPDPANPTNVCVIWNSNISGQQGTTNDLQGEWGTLEAIAFALDDVSDTGPYVLYLDNIVNGGLTNPPIVVEDFENAPAGTADHTFRVPGFSGTTTPFLMTAPNEAVVSNDAADTGTKSLRVQFQWVSLATNNWLRLTTYQAPRGHPNPLVNLNDPISFRILLLPPGSSPTPPPRPTLSASLVNGAIVLTWPGGHNLQTATVVTGPYTNATIGTSPVTLAPYNNTYPEAQRFFRLAN